ncbi:ATP-binding protein [Butyrivibrio sp. AE2005]|uniref:ATP-binding protein n=1 Tax=Butyrivibrio sp. AE2005 TaxID=1496722 RepID=UPI00047E6E8E|nr:DUF87 domain-containing protein [Butyrivibrio sp. AE2005]
MASIVEMVDNSSIQNNPIRKVKEFIDKQNQYKSIGDVEHWRFVGYVLDISYESAQIITNDTYKIAVGGIPRGSFLILVPANFDKVQPHFTLLRVKEICATPLSQQVQQTYFEMHKRSMPELDIWTQADLQWGSLRCDTLGMFYADPNNVNKLAFSGDVNNVVSAHRYEVYAPDEELLNLIVNGTVKNELQEEIGHLRTMECMFGVNRQESGNIPVKISMRDFMGCRTAMFGKTRLGKSNVVKLIAQGMLDATKETKNVGQLIFDINGEYANDSDQDNVSLRSANPERCEVYALTQRPNTPSKQLKLNFYENASSCKDILGTLLSNAGRSAIYVTSFASVVLPTPEEMDEMDMREKIHAIRRIQIYWAILREAGFAADEGKLRTLRFMNTNNVKALDPHFSDEIRKKVYGSSVPDRVPSLEGMVDEFREFMRCYRDNNEDQKAAFGKEVFEKDDILLLEFLFPKSGRGPAMLSQFKMYHSEKAGDFVKDIIASLNDGKTVILDLGNANDSIRQYFSDLLSMAVFREQETKFVSNGLGDNYIELYFEEAHNLFPPHAKDNKDVYSRFAKEGAKFHIGMVYSTQSPSTISQELLVQTENFFVGHLASTSETSALTKTQIAFDGVEEDILRAKTPGYMRMLTMSNRFIIPVQAKLYSPKRGE